MESLIYNHAQSDAAVRRADLRQALQAFLADASSRSAIHLVGLFVRIPTPSTITATNANSPARSSPSTASTGNPITTATTASSSSARHGNAQKLAWCAFEADRRLREATDDARELNAWLAHGALVTETQSGTSSSRKNSHRRSSSMPSRSSAAAAIAGISVVVVAYLAPHAREDMTVYESWQRCAEGSRTETSQQKPLTTSQTTRQLSPLRRAALIALSLGAPSLLLAWGEQPRRCFLSSLLLAHQSLLLDFSWCLQTSVESGAVVTERTASHRGKGERVTSQVLQDLYFQDVQPSLQLPKGDSRCALWCSYASVMAALHPAVFQLDGVDLNLANGDTAGVRRRYGSRFGQEDDAPAFLKTHALMRQVFSSLFTGGGGGVAPGRTQALRVVLSYGGAVSTLKRQLVHLHGGANAHSCDAALLRTRSLVDMHALFGVLVGQDRVDHFAEAAGFVRTAQRRMTSPAATLATTATGALEAARCTFVHVAVERHTHTPRMPVAAAASQHRDSPSPPQLPSNAFVEQGVRTLARRFRRLERQRLGKTKLHLRPRTRAALQRKRAHQLKATKGTQQSGSTAVALHVVGKKRGADIRSIEQSNSVNDAKAAGSDAMPSKKAKLVREKKTAASDRPASADLLSWSVDVGG